MRILYASERPPYPFFLGGAARCAHRLLVSLVKDFGVVALAIGSEAYRTSAWAWPPKGDEEALGVAGQREPRGYEAGPVLDCTYPVAVLRDDPVALRAIIRDFAPDVIWAQLEGAHEVLTTARSVGVPSVLFVHDAEDHPTALRGMAELGCHVVCGSRFLARKTARVIGRSTHVVHPASDWYFDTSGRPDGYVTMINPHAVKGVDTFLAIARRLPERRFLLVESWKLSDAALAELQRKLDNLPNVNFRRRVADVRDIYRETRLLLVPSVWEEGFGMVAVEAQSCGIPVIASNRGGLPESVGSGGRLIMDYRNVAPWIAAIQALDDPARYREAAKDARAHAESAEFSAREQARRFLDVCTSPPPSARPIGRVARMVPALLAGLPGLRWLRRGDR